MNLDPRLHAIRDDLADARLNERVERPAYADPVPYTVAQPRVPCVRGPGGETLETEYLFGEPLNVFFGRPPDSAPSDGSDDSHDDDIGAPESPWWWVQSALDGYVGYVSSHALEPGHTAPTHRVNVPRGLAFRTPSIRAGVVRALPLNARVSVEETLEEKEVFHRLADGTFLLDQHCTPIGPTGGDYVALAETFIGAPYRWGGKSWEGLDCSALVQLAIQATGGTSPRDSDMQVTLGTPLALDSTALQRGDLIFWKGHVGIMRDPVTLLHANGHHMVTATEPLADAAARMEAQGLPITHIRRMG